MVDPAGAWRRSAGKYWEQILANFPQAKCGGDDPIDCFSAEKFIKHVFMDSDCYNGRSSDKGLQLCSFHP
jgi:hypothetical protein